MEHDENMLMAKGCPSEVYDKRLAIVQDPS